MGHKVLFPSFAMGVRMPMIAPTAVSQYYILPSSGGVLRIHGLLGLLFGLQLFQVVE